MTKQTALSALNSTSYGEKQLQLTYLFLWDAQKISQSILFKYEKNHDWGFIEDCAVYKRIRLEKSVDILQK